MCTLSRVHVLGYRCRGLRCRYLQQRRTRTTSDLGDDTDPHRCAFDPEPVIRGLFSATHLLPFIHVGSQGGAEPQPCRLPRQLSQKDGETGKVRLWLKAAKPTG